MGQTHDTDTDIIGYRAAAKLLDAPIGTLFSMVSRKQVPHFRLSPRIVKFSRRELRRWIEERRIEVA